MVAHDGRERDAVDDAADGIEPGVPLGMILAVVDEIAHVDEERGIRVPAGRILGELLPAVVVVRLRVREHEQLEGAAVIGGERVPGGARFAAEDAVFIVLPGLEAGDSGGMQPDAHAVIGEGFAGGRDSGCCFAAAQPPGDFRALLLLVGLPHDGAAGTAVGCDELADIVCLQGGIAREGPGGFLHWLQDWGSRKGAAACQGENRAAGELQEAAAGKNLLVHAKTPFVHKS